MKRFGYPNVTVHKADAKNFDYGALGPIAFALVDLDLYRPVKESLERIFPQMAPGGVILVDDCGEGEGGRWDGAYQAFREFCAERNMSPRIVCQKIGIILHLTFSGQKQQDRIIGNLGIEQARTRGQQLNAECVQTIRVINPDLLVPVVDRPTSYTKPV